MPHTSPSVPPLVNGAVAFTLSLAALWALFFLLLQESISWPGLLLIPLMIGAIAFDVARKRGPIALQRFLARPPVWLRVILHFVVAALLFSVMLLLLNVEHLSWPVVLATSTLVVFGSELSRRDEADGTAGKQEARWSRHDKLMLGVGVSALIIYSVLLAAWGLPENLREWLILGFVYAFPVAMLLFVLLRRRR